MAMDRGSGGSMSQINVTPLVDVMLVLLVIFMVTAPILQQGVKVDLPQAAVGALTGDENQIVISIVRAGEVFVDDDEVAPGDLIETLVDRAGPGNEASAPIYIRADRRLSYGEVMRVMAEIHAAGFRRVGLVTEESEEALELDQLGDAERL
jgi:biopolymer transport protein TolR